MKNYEKYVDEIKNYEGNNFCNNFVIPVIRKGCECLGSCEQCRMLQMLWLLEEYEEPKEPEEPEIDWSKVKVDTPILVRDAENTEWLKKHFAKYEDGIVYVWNLGRTSWSAPNNKSVSAWQYAKLIEDETESGVDWSEVEVDTPILVRDNEDTESATVVWLKRYFAEYKDGLVYAWTNGRTSWNEDEMYGWQYAKLAESEDSK